MARAHWIGLAAAIIVIVASAHAEEKRWTGGAGNGNWSDDNNWFPAGKPGAGDDVVIPGGSGDIKLPGGDPAHVMVKSLKMECPPAGTSTIRPQPDDRHVEITAQDFVEIGPCGVIRGNDGTSAHPKGGNVDIIVLGTGGHIRNEGLIIGGSGDVPADGGVPAPGGDVTLKGNTITNTGRELGGMGGSKGAGVGNGARGGNVTNQATGPNGTVQQNGEKKGGPGGGPGSGGGVQGPDGKVACLAPGSVQVGPANVMTGRTIEVRVNPGGLIGMQGLPPNAIHAAVTVFIDAGFPGGQVLLFGAGPNCIVAGQRVCVRGNAVTSQGVTLAMLTQPDAQSCVNCPGDYNADGAVDDFDAFDFLNDFFAGSFNADINNDESVDDFDYFEFLNAFFGPC
ncbi:MAG: hypothetical protein JNM07_12015 [Phycisphaerae bacterium]|nr:hypothetical protein [Phycisphaerae bacterium]